MKFEDTFREILKAMRQLAEGNDNYTLELDSEVPFAKEICQQFAHAQTWQKQSEELFIQRATELTTVMQASKVISTIMQPDELLQKVVDLTKSNFGFYHVDIYVFDEEREMLTLRVGSGEVGKQMVAQDWEISLSQEQSLVAKAARTCQAVAVQDVRQSSEYLPVKQLPDTLSEAIIPMTVGDALLGVLDIQSNHVGYFTEDMIRIQTALASQVAIALQHAYQYEQTQLALTETETFYNIAFELNTATSLDKGLHIIASSISSIHPLAQSPSCAIIFTFGMNIDAEPIKKCKVSAIMTTSDKVSVDAPHVKASIDAPTLPLEVGQRIKLADLPLIDVLLEHHDSPIFILDINQDTRFTRASDLGLIDIGTKAMVLLPLVLGSRWVGVTLIGWQNPHLFTEREQRFYDFLATQSAVVIDSQLRFQLIQERAIYLEKLLAIQSALSDVHDETEMLAIISMALTFDIDMRIILFYIRTDNDGTPIELQRMAVWEQGIVQSGDNIESSYQTFPIIDLWLEEPNQIVFFQNIHDDPCSLEAFFELGKKMNFEALAILPLWSEGRWQGLLTFDWPKPRHLVDEEVFVLQQLTKSIGAVIGSHRAHLVEKRVLENTETLYRTSYHIALANNLQEIVDVLARELRISDVDRIILMGFERDASGSIVAAAILASWHTDDGPLSTLVGIQYRQPIFPVSDEWIMTQPAFIADTETYELIPGDIRGLLTALKIKSVAAFPLWVGSLQVGILVLESQHYHEFIESEVQPYIAVMGEIAVAVDNNRLFNQAEKRTKQLRAAARISQEISSILDFEQLLPQVVGMIQKTFEYYHTAVYLLDETQQAFVVGEAAGHASEKFKKNGLVIPVDDEVSVITHAAYSLEPIVINDVVNDDRYGTNPLLPATLSQVILPIYIGQTISGVLDVQHDIIGHFNEDELRTLLTITSQLAIAIANVNLFEQNQAALDETAAQAKRLALLNELSTKLALETSVDMIFNIGVVETKRIIEADSASVVLLSEDKNNLIIRQSSETSDLHKEQKAWQISNTMMGKALEQNRIVLLSDMRDNPEKDACILVEQGFNSAMMAPLTVRGQAIGTLNVFHRNLNAYITRDKSLLQQIASMLATTVESRRLFNQTQERAVQLEKLTQTQAVLSQITLAEEVLATLAPVFDTDLPERIMLGYLEVDDR
ncbi:MAG: hypothetical protein B6242_09535 [Anaerolineaceae bacterium 4572_78]|nr:MAG: hypothetical protein B6242_09535 [Anaerolineaceae bacterium 4572_78]